MAPLVAFAKCFNTDFQSQPVPSRRAPSAGRAKPCALPTRPRNPLHGITLEMIVTALAERVPVRCFSSQPSVSSNLQFLRKTSRAREKVKSLYLFMLHEHRREQRN